MNRSSLISTALAFAILSTSSCATKSTANHNNNDEKESTLESYNRAMFNFNLKVDRYIVKPVAKGYRAITNQDIRDRVNSALSNVLEPLSAANQLLQGEVKQSGISVSRFAVNSTLGLAGTFDVASGWGLEKKSDGFDDTLAKWCVPDGPFFVLPFFGPSTPRATTGLMVDSVSNPVFLATNGMPDGRQNTIVYSYGIVRVIALRESGLDLLDDLERNSVDFYATMRSAYLQNRAKKNCYGSGANYNGSSNTYDFDFGIEEEDEAFNEIEDESASAVPSLKTVPQANMSNLGESIDKDEIK